MQIFVILKHVSFSFLFMYLLHIVCFYFSHFCLCIYYILYVSISHTSTDKDMKLFLVSEIEKKNLNLLVKGFNHIHVVYNYFSYFYDIPFHNHMVSDPLATSKEAAHSTINLSCYGVCAM